MLQLSLYPDLIEAGCDEAGRGCLAGPVFAAAVILPADFYCEELNDSKQLSEKARYRLRPVIEEKAISFAIGIVDHEEIDKINILNASFLAMHRAIASLNCEPQHLLIDGNRFKKYGDIKHSCIVKGDSKFQPIAAASILAKTYRDDFMMNLHNEFPHYKWDKNKGYPTAEHRKAIEIHGVSPYHRLSFNLFDRQLKLDL
ncbi:ribonuclease HII [Dysgonomonas sp. 520]|uniref:ribonuclease HII n=1 Tax=Dysgonomonas sp. 520 TaxID=2302931 RepID=UPI0013D0F255|nr:ribonuclease HII [Dysgonomonas sp. 520]NDW10260.1 ribonuclease HII [Dysgonomonas sp. 520]